MDFILPQEYKWLLNFCGFYKGEAEDPFEKRFKQLEESNSVYVVKFFEILKRFVTDVVVSVTFVCQNESFGVTSVTAT